MATRANVEAAKDLVRPRFGDQYVYGGMFSPNNIKQGTDCSGVWNDVLGTAVGRFQWGRENEGATTESYRYIEVGEVGPFGTIRVARPEDIPANAVVKLAFHHEGNGGESSHMWGEIDGMRIESAGNPKGLVTAPQAWEITNPYANAWAYLPGPIVEDGSEATTSEPADTVFADVSEWQLPVDDRYPYRTISIRSNDGTHRDLDWAANYAWCKAACDAGKLTHFYVYFVWRQNWEETLATLKSQVGVPHPKMVVEIDVESWQGQITGDNSAALNTTYVNLTEWLSDNRKVVAYGNTGDLNNLWPRKPAGLPIRLAAYGSNPDYPGKFAHQYTDGGGYGGGLSEGAVPFGNCDMNSADGYTATQLAAFHGIETEGDEFVGVNADRLNEAVDKILGGGTSPADWLSRGMLAPAGEQVGGVDDTVGMLLNTDGNAWNVVMIIGALLGVERDVQAIRDNAAGKFPAGSYVAGNPWLKARAQEFAQKLLPLCGLLNASAFTPPAAADPHPPATPVPDPVPVPDPTPPAAPVVRVACQIGGGACALVEGDGDGTCALGGATCVLVKGLAK